MESNENGQKKSAVDRPRGTVGCEVRVSFDHLSDAEFLELVTETIEFIALDASIPIDPAELPSSEEDRPEGH